MTHRKRLAAALIVSLPFLFSPGAQAAIPDTTVVGAAVDHGANTVTISGTGFIGINGTGPTVTLGLHRLVIQSATMDTIVAQLPAGIAPGSYLVTVKTGSGSNRYDESVVAVGVQGPAGPEGPQGATGAQGPAGAPGPQGPAGAIGPQGPAGAIGPQGPAGPAGPAGPQGATGPAGPAGLQGVQGPAGEPGASGAPGAPGAPGAAGAPGKDSRIKLTAVPSGPICNAAGVKIEVGTDTNGNGALDAGEVTDTQYVCGVSVPGSQFGDWLVGTPCNGTDFGGGCTAAETGYHYLGQFDGYQCWWHTKNQAWNTTTATNIYSLAQRFGLNPASARSHWCVPRSAIPTPTTLGTPAFGGSSNISAWGWCGGPPFASGGWICLQ
jgi:hypothetical protein